MRELKNYKDLQVNNAKNLESNKVFFHKPNVYLNSEATQEKDPTKCMNQGFQSM